MQYQKPNEVLASAIANGIMSKNEAEMIAHDQGISYDEDTKDEFNRFNDKDYE